LIACRCWAEEHASKRPAYAVLRGNGTLSARCHSDKCNATLSGLLAGLDLETRSLVAQTPEEAVAKLNAMGATYIYGGFVVPTMSDDRLYLHMKNMTALSYHARMAPEQVGAWIMSDKRREAHDFTLCDAPHFEIVDGRLNLWRGLAIAPERVAEQEARVEAWMQSIHENLCAGDEEAAKYLTRLLSWKLPNPLKLPQAAIYLSGPGGTGKSVMCVPYMRLFGVHAKQFTTSVGRFNVPFFGRAVIFHDEITKKDFVRREHELRGAITERALQYEDKGQSTFMGPNIALHIFATNDEDVLIPPGDRRFLFVRGRAVPLDWFVARDLHSVTTREGNDEFLRALHYRLLQVRVPAGWLPGDIPTTAAKRDAIERGLNPIMAWMLHCIETGLLCHSQALPLSVTLREPWQGEVVLSATEKRDLHLCAQDWVRGNYPNAHRDGLWQVPGLATVEGFVRVLHNYLGATTPRTAKERKMVIPSRDAAKKAFNALVMRESGREK
jgi:hypothetical protein